ncbi:MAG: hypothetical protein LLF94_08895 [Chlamydiales bacterium]|nr:hypothetical protein [Chlamydiales bacterium]
MIAAALKLTVFSRNLFDRATLNQNYADFANLSLPDFVYLQKKQTFHSIESLQKLGFATAADANAMHSLCERYKECSWKLTSNVARECKNFSFDAVGDAVYLEEEVDAWEDIIQNVINKEHPAFVVHVGDFQIDPRGLDLPATALPIALTENQIIEKRNFWWKIKAPLIVTPGDNDWSDTIADPTGPPPGNPPYPPNPDPIGTLNAFRNVWYEQGTNVKFPFKVVSQPDEFPEFYDYIENKRWCYHDIVFVTINTISGDNGLDPADSIYPEARQAIIDEASGPNGRIAANQAWLNKAFDVAQRKGARGLVIVTQAYPGFYDGGVSPGFEDELTTIRNRTIDNIPNNLQVLFVYGDLHFFNVDKPFPLLGDSPV